MDTVGKLQISPKFLTGLELVETRHGASLHLI